MANHVLCGVLRKLKISRLQLQSNTFVCNNALVDAPISLKCKDVSRYGLGKWKKILKDKEFYFNGRRPCDLCNKWRCLIKCSICQGLPNDTSDESMNVLGSGCVRIDRRYAKWTLEEEENLLSGVRK